MVFVENTASDTTHRLTAQFKHTHFLFVQTIITDLILMFGNYILTEQKRFDTIRRTEAKRTETNIISTRSCRIRIQTNRQG